jgi:hypothetical protein
VPDLPTLEVRGRPPGVDERRPENAEPLRGSQFGAGSLDVRAPTVTVVLKLVNLLLLRRGDLPHKPDQGPEQELVLRQSDDHSSHQPAKWQPAQKWPLAELVSSPHVLQVLNVIRSGPQ